MEGTAATRPGERLAEVAGAGAHYGCPAPVGQQARYKLGTPGLEAADRVRRFQLDTYRAAKLARQCVALVQRSIQKYRIDHVASRADPVKIEARPDHDETAYPTAVSP
jgi:hypothetical protein